MTAPSPNMKPDELRANDAFSSQAQLFAWLQCSQEKSKIKDGESIHPTSILVIKKKTFHSDRLAAESVGSVTLNTGSTGLYCCPLSFSIMSKGQNQQTNSGNQNFSFPTTNSAAMQLWLQKSQ